MKQHHFTTHPRAIQKLQKNLPHPVTETDKSFMSYLLQGVRQIRIAATARLPTVTPNGQTEQRKSNHERNL
jgi:hypothetical protein